MGELNQSSEKSDLPCIYAGNMVSMKEKKNNFFYFYFPNPESADLPLVLYMDGGPGSSSMNALFNKNGPLRCYQDDKKD